MTGPLPSQTVVACCSESKDSDLDINHADYSGPSGPVSYRRNDNLEPRRRRAKEKKQLARPPTAPTATMASVEQRPSSVASTSRQPDQRRQTKHSSTSRSKRMSGSSAGRDESKMIGQWRIGRTIGKGSSGAHK